MILLPIGHERQTVQRLPWVTFILIGICFVAYLYTGIIADTDDSALSNKVNEYFDFYTQHPYLEMPPEMGQFLTAVEEEKLDALKEGVDRSLLNSSEVRAEQHQLEQMALDIMDLMNANPLRKYGYVPNDPHFFNLFTCLFLHAGFWHLFGNMLFLFLAGCAIEDLWGRPVFLGFYLLSGLAATITHDLKFPTSAVPIIGASGAIAGLMGAFLVRLAKTKIKFFYFFFLFTIKTGTFEAPAFIMLPLWFVQQILLAAISDQSAGTAFWAHIGGFAFGAVFAFGMSLLRIEERFIAPAIEKKVSLVQNPLFLQAIRLSEQGDFPHALVMLQKVVRQEPNNVDAFLEMRNLYERTFDKSGYTKACAGILDAALRGKDTEMLTAQLQQFRQSDLRTVLPPKTLLGLAAYYEENNDEHSAVSLYEEILEHHRADPLAMKAASKMARACMEKLSDRERGEAAFWTAYQHPLANEEWRKALQLDMKRYQIDPANAPPEHVEEVAPVAVASAPVLAPYDPTETYSDTNEEESSANEAPEPPPAPPPVAPKAVTVAVLPATEFDGPYSEWTVVACHLGKIALKGLNLRNTKENSAMLPWKKIRFVSAGRIRSLGGGKPGARDSLIFDLVVSAPGNGLVVYRTTGKAMNFKQIFPGVEQTFFDAYENFLGILLSNSGARCIPSRELCAGPVFEESKDLAAYEKRVRDEISKTG